MLARRRGDSPLPFAIEVVRRDGPAALTMRNVAAEASVSATALYRHYRDKDALVDAVIRAIYQRFRVSLAGDVSAVDKRAWLQVACDRVLRFALAEPNFYRILFCEAHARVDKYPRDFVAGRTAGFRQLRDLVASCMTAGVLRGDPQTDAPDVALTLFAHMHGLIALWLTGRFPDALVFERFFHESIGRLLDGLTR